MSPLAHTLLYAVRYAHGRSLHPYEEVVVTVRQVWSLLTVRDRRHWVNLVRSQVPSDLERMNKASDGRYLPVTQDELEKEREAYEDLLRWCEKQMDAAVVQISPPE